MPATPSPTPSLRLLLIVALLSLGAPGCDYCGFPLMFLEECAERCGLDANEVLNAMPWTPPYNGGCGRCQCEPVEATP